MSAVRIDAVTTTRKGRYALFSGGEFLFSLDAETYAKSNITEGSSLQSEELSLLKDASLTRRAKDQALRYLARRPYGEMELYAKLCLRYDEHSAAAAVAAMREVGLLDDAQFARRRAEAMLEKGKSSGEIRRALTALGVDRELVAAALDELNPNDAAGALEIVRKLYWGKLAKGAKPQVMAALARRGFAHGDIRRAVDAALAEMAEEGLETGEEAWEEMP